MQLFLGGTKQAHFFVPHNSVKLVVGCASFGREARNGRSVLLEKSMKKSAGFSIHRPNERFIKG